MIQDVTGLTLGEALRLLEAAGVTDVDVKMTAPPREKNRQYDSDSRVVRQLVHGNGSSGEGVELVVCNIKDVDKTDEVRF